MRPALRVVGIAAAESEFPSGAAPHYDLYATTAYAAAFNSRVALLRTYYVRLAHGGADLAGFDSRFRSPDVTAPTTWTRPRSGPKPRSGRRSSAGMC